MAKVIVTGASGFIGGQTALQLHDLGHEVVGIDIVNPSSALKSIFSHFINDDFAGDEALEWICRSGATAIVHCAGTSLVGPSIADPATYYDNNFIKTKMLMDRIVAEKLPIRIIYSSSAAVYGEPVMTPINEVDPCLPLSPYGESKLMTELLLRSYHVAYKLDSVIFRYFNACGADPGGRHGQEPNATHIVARVLESIKNSTEFTIYGIDYATTDGTCVRDYVHVDDIALAHVLAVSNTVPSDIYNLGANADISVMNIINLAQEITNTAVIMTMGGRRPGDPAILGADATKFKKVSGWYANYDMYDIISHAWNWYKK
jgi:UDP-glucose 4-epimerase